MRRAREDFDRSLLWIEVTSDGDIERGLVVAAFEGRGTQSPVLGSKSVGEARCRRRSEGLLLEAHVFRKLGHRYGVSDFHFRQDLDKPEDFCVNVSKSPLV